MKLFSHVFLSILLWVFSGSVLAVSSASAASPALTTPAVGSSFDDSSQSFSWNAQGNDIAYWSLSIGSSKGKSDYFRSNRLQGTETGITVKGLPVDAHKAFVRLRYKQNGKTWKRQDYVFYLAGENHPPVISGTPKLIARIGSPYKFQATATDADGEKLKFTIKKRPRWARFKRSKGILSGTPNKARTYQNIVITVQDERGATASLPAFSIVTFERSAAMDKALRTGDASLVTEDEIVSKINETVSQQLAACKARVNSVNSPVQICDDALASELILKTVTNLHDNLLDFDYSNAAATCLSYIGRLVCKDDLLMNSDGQTLGQSFMQGAKIIKRKLTEFDAKGASVFDSDDTNTVLKLAVLLGDKYRATISYPMDKVATDDNTFFKALFADYSVHYARSNNTYQPDMGDYTTDPSLLNGLTGTNETVTLTPTTFDEWTSSLLYALPGKNIVIRRTDNSDNTVKVMLTLLREGSSRIWNKNRYTRPAFMRSHEITIEKGRDYHLSTPYGGSIMVYSKGVATSPQSFTLEFENISKNSTLSQFDQGSIDTFLSELDNSVYDWVDIKTPYVEIHSLKSKMKEAFSTAGYYPYHNNGSQYLKDLKTYLIDSNLNLAGYRGEGLSLNAEVQNFCITNNLDCTSAIHNKPKVQHVNSDINAQCGSGCSGNPYDASWAVTPTGWGDNHEFGHNLQRPRFKIYGRKSTEVSNNIFPLHSNWKYLVDHNLRMHPKYNENTEGVFDLLYKAVKNNTPANENHPLWSSPGLYDNAFDRLAFYDQLVHLHQSWDIYTKLHLVERIFTDALKEQTKWDSKKDKLGFSNYTKDEASKINGNDFLAITLSKFMDMDHRDYFDMWGIEVSQQAKDQIATNGFSQTVPREFFIRKHNKIMTQFRSKTVLLDGTDINKYTVSGVCTRSSVSACKSINAVHTLPTPASGNLYFLSKYASNGETTPISNGASGYSRLSIAATDDLGNPFTLNLRAAKTSDITGVNGLLLPMNDTNSVSAANTSLVVWIDPSDNNLSEGRTYSTDDTLVIKAMQDGVMTGQIIVEIGDFQLPETLTLTDPATSLIRGYPLLNGYATYFVATNSEQGPTTRKWSYDTPTEVLNTKVKDENGIEHKLVLRTKRDGLRASGISRYYNDINSGGTWEGVNGTALVIWYDATDNPSLSSGRYTSSELLVLKAKSWGKETLREMLNIQVDFTLP